MSDSRQRDYLRGVLALDPGSEAELILRRRREFLEPSDVIMAESVEDPSDDVDLRTRMRNRLNDLRRDFWNISDEQLAQRLPALQRVEHAETVAAAARLQQVAEHRQSLHRLYAEPGVQPAFVRALAEILIAPQAEANRLREREHRAMRPDQNKQYETAWRAAQTTARVIRSRYPQVFSLEEAWLTELIEYNPIKETENETANVIYGLMMLAGIGLTLYTSVRLVIWIFS